MVESVDENGLQGAPRLAQAKAVADIRCQDVVAREDYMERWLRRWWIVAWRNSSMEIGYSMRL